MNTITRMDKRSEAFIAGLPAGMRLWRTCKDEAADVIFRASDRSGWDENFLWMLYEELQTHKKLGNILSAAYLIEEMADEEDPLDLLQAAMVNALGDVKLVIDIFVELIDEDGMDPEEAALEVEAVCWRKRKEQLS